MKQSVDVVDCLFNCYDTKAQTICNNMDALLGFAQTLKCWLVSQLVLDLSAYINGE